MTDWPEYLKAFRKRHGLTQQELAVKLPCTLRFIEDIEQDIYPPTPLLQRALWHLESELDADS